MPHKKEVAVNKKVLVIDRAQREKIGIAVQLHLLRYDKKQIDIMELDNAIREEWLKAELPGNLLAEEKINGQIRLRAVEKKLRGYLSEDRPVTLLIVDGGEK